MIQLINYFSHRVLDESLVKEVLTLDRSVPEAVISEDEEVCTIPMLVAVVWTTGLLVQ